MPSKRANHSSLKHNDLLYVSGGKGNNAIEYFDTKKYKWSTMLGRMAIEREFPVLFVHSNYLYNFFGISNNNCTDKVERIELTGKGNSQLVEYTKEANFDLKIYGAGIIEMSPDVILIVGGKKKDVFNRDNIFQYDFSETKFDCFNFDIDSDVLL